MKFVYKNPVLILHLEYSLENVAIWQTLMKCSFEKLWDIMRYLTMINLYYH